MKHTLLWVLFCFTTSISFSQFKKETSSHYKTEIDRIREVYKVPTAFGYIKSITEVNGEIREDLRIFYKTQSGEVDDRALYSRVVPSTATSSVDGSMVTTLQVNKSHYQLYGDILYMGGTAFAVIFKPRKNKKNYLIKILKPSTPTSASLTDNSYLKDYEITVEQWNGVEKAKLLARLAEYLVESGSSCKNS